MSSASIRKLAAPAFQQGSLKDKFVRSAGLPALLDVQTDHEAVNMNVHGDRRIQSFEAPPDGSGALWPPFSPPPPRMLSSTPNHGGLALFLMPALIGAIYGYLYRKREKTNGPNNNKESGNSDVPLEEVSEAPPNPQTEV